jgi:pyruvate,orthophosphate dikinase
VPVAPAPSCDYFEGNVDPASEEADSVKAVDRIMKIADRVRRLRVRANADTPEDAARAGALRRRGHRPVPHRAHVPR